MITNARYIKTFEGMHIANLHGVMTPAQCDQLVEFWLSNGAILDEREAKRRTAEVVHLAFDEEERILGVNTCFVAAIDSGKGPEPFWFYRQFTQPSSRYLRISRNLGRLSISYFEQLYRLQNGPVGIAIHLENPKLYIPSAKRALSRQGLGFLGKDARNIEIWVRRFDAAPTQPTR